VDAYTIRATPADLPGIEHRRGFAGRAAAREREPGVAAGRQRPGTGAPSAWLRSNRACLPAQTGVNRKRRRRVRAARTPRSGV